MNDIGMNVFPSAGGNGGGDDKGNQGKPKQRPGRVDGRNSKWKSGHTSINNKLSKQIKVILMDNQDKAAKKDKKVGVMTQEKREMDIFSFFSDLTYLGYKLESVYNLKQKHLLAVFNFLEEQGQAPATIQNKISRMRTFCEWIGKKGMVLESHYYVKDKTSVKRTMVCQVDKSWTAHGVDPMKILTDIRAIRNGKEERVAVWLEQCWAFGVRIQESVMMLPAVGDQGEALYVREGTKGGRARFVPIKNELQRSILEKTKCIMDKKTGMLGKRGKSVKANLRHFYYVMEKIGITEAVLGVTAHGLRHQYAQAQHKLLTGVEAPIKGGDISTVEKYKYHLASLAIMHHLGHGRVSVGASYYGSRRRVKKKTGAQTEGQEKEPDNDA